MDRQFAEMAVQDDDENPFGVVNREINYDELYSFCTRQAARKTTDQPAKHRKVSSTRQHLGASQGAYDASEEVIRHMAKKRKMRAQRQEGHISTRSTDAQPAQRQEGQSSTSSANTRPRPPQSSAGSAYVTEQTCTARSLYVLTINAAQRTVFDTKSVQLAVHDLNGMQKAMLDGISQGPLDKQLVEDIEHTSAVLEMAARVIAINTEHIIR